jgi:chromosome segregation ATPase
MDSEKYMNSYVEVLKNTLNEYFYANITLQTNQKFMESALKEQGEQIQKYMVMIADYEENKQTKTEEETQKVENAIREKERLEKVSIEKEHEISRLRDVVQKNEESLREKERLENQLNEQRNEIEKIKNGQRDEIQKLINQVEHLSQVNSALEFTKTENESLKTEIQILKQNIASAQSTQLAPKQTNKSFVKKGLVQTQVEDDGNF